MAARIVRLIEETGLTHFACRSKRELAITAMVDEACAFSGRKRIKVGPDNDDVADTCGLQTGDLAIDGAPKTDDLNVSRAPHVASD